jgi:hypothetical protein
VTLLATTACSSNSSILPQAREIASSLRATAAADLCRITGFWHFQGACKAFTVLKTGESVVLQAYEGYTLKAIYARSQAPDNTRFRTGDGTSDQDITGLYKSVVFPEYGRVGCIDLKSDKVPCPGKGFLYNVVRNDSSAQVIFSTSPEFTISSTHALPGSNCEELLLQLTADGNGFVWMRLPVYAKPKNGTMTFAPKQMFLNYTAKAHGVFGFACTA